MQRVDWTDERIGDFAQGVDRDIRELRGEMRSEFGEVRNEFAAVRGEMRSEFAEVRGEMRGEFAEVRGEIGALRAIVIRGGGIIMGGLLGVIAAVFAHGA